jgi:hypothetical protein
MRIPKETTVKQNSTLLPAEKSCGGRKTLATLCYRMTTNNKTAKGNVPVHTIAPPFAAMLSPEEPAIPYQRFFE